MISLTFLVHYFPFLGHPRWFVNKGEAERRTVLAPIQVLCSHVYILRIFTDVLHWVDQGGAMVIDVLDCDHDRARDGFSRIILKTGRKETRMFRLHC